MLDVSAHVYPNGIAAGRFQIAREARGWSLEAVAFHADTPATVLADVERGTIEPTPALIVRVADLLGFPVGFFHKPVETWLTGPMFVCGRGPKRPAMTPRCRLCHLPHSHLCDYPIGEGKTCSAPLCREHRIQMVPGVDYCPDHADQHRARMQPSLL